MRSIATVMQSLLSNPSLPLFALIGASVILIAFLIIVILLSRRVTRLLRGKDAENLEHTIIRLGQELAELREFQAASEAYFENVEARLRRSVQSIETIRFNPWKGSGEGGNHSFATSLLNEHGDGVVISCLYSRDRVNLYSKPIQKHASEFGLTDEEAEALARSRAKVESGKSLHL